MVKIKLDRSGYKTFRELQIKPVGIQEIQYLNIESYLLGDCTVRIGDCR
jgi:hypothetical protein